MPSELMIGFYIFMLAAFAGFVIVAKAPPRPHTILMASANILSGISIVGALLIAAAADTTLAKFVGFLAVTMSAINLVGGFLVTKRMLQADAGQDEGKGEETTA